MPFAKPVFRAWISCRRVECSKLWIPFGHRQARGFEEASTSPRNTKPLKFVMHRQGVKPQLVHPEHPKPELPHPLNSKP